MSHHDPNYMHKREKAPSALGKSSLRRAAVKPGSERALSSTSDVVLNSAGQQAGQDARIFTEPHFEHDFSQVKLHANIDEAGPKQTMDALASEQIGMAQSANSQGLLPLGTQRIHTPSASTTNHLIKEARERTDAGTQLQDADRATMEKSFGQDLSDVRLHTGEGADALANILGAKAATIGHDIYVASDQYHPQSVEWRKLLGHEVAHVVQTDGREGSGPQIGEGTSSYEQEASNAAEAVALGKLALVSHGGTPAQVQLTPRPLPPDYVTMTFPSPLDVEPVLDFCRRTAGIAPGYTGQLLGGAGSVFDNSPNLEGDITSAFQSGYFRQGGNTSWSSGQRTWDPGFLAPYYTVTVSIRLLEDNVREAGAGSQATVGSTSGVTATTGTSASTQTQTSASAGGTGGKKDEGSVTGSVGTQSQTTLGTTSQTSMGGSATSSQTAGTSVYQSDVFAEVTISVRQWDRVATYHTYGGRSIIPVGTAQYTRLRLTPVATPAPTP